MYRERPSRVPGGFVWSSVSTGDDIRVLPDGCMDLLWDGHEISIAGADTHAQLFAGTPGSTMTGLRFAPGYAPRCSGVPADRVHRSTRAARRGVGGRPRFGASPTSSPRAAVPVRALESSSLRAAAPDPTTTRRSSSGSRTSLAPDTTARRSRDRIGLSTRQLQRRSTAAFGYGAKTLGRSPAHAASTRARTRRGTRSPTRRRAPATPTSRTSPATSRTGRRPARVAQRR